MSRAVARRQAGSGLRPATRLPTKQARRFEMVRDRYGTRGVVIQVGGAGAGKAQRLRCRRGELVEGEGRSVRANREWTAAARFRNGPVQAPAVDPDGVPGRVHVVPDLLLPLLLPSLLILLLLLAG